MKLLGHFRQDSGFEPTFSTLWRSRARVRVARSAPRRGAAPLEILGPQGRPWKDFRERDGTGVVYGKNLFCQESRAVHVGTRA